MQQSAIVFTLLAPLILWVVCRRFGSERLREIVRRSLAIALLVLEVASVADKIATGQGPATGLPLQLCDWALVAITGALWFRWQLGFELGYFWGLAGTLPTLFTPALDPANVWWRLFAFFYLHALIVVSVLHLVITERYRPQPGALGRVAACSASFLVVALLVNAATGGNYGFLSHRPPQATPLDLFSENHWLYVAELGGVGLLLFALLYLPWWFTARRGLREEAIRP